jgi:FkbM family methyltransferase
MRMPNTGGSVRLESVAPVPGTALERSVYRWQGRRLVFFTDSTAPDEYTESLRAAFWIQPVARFASAWLRGRGTCIDAGANLGAIAVPIASCGTRVLAIEPMPATAALLRRTAAANGGRIEVVEAAAGVGPGRAFMRGTSAWAQSGPGGDIEVAVTSVDALCEAHPRFARPALVKIDVEGAERLVLEGMQGVIARARPLIIVEANAWTARDFGHTCADLLGDLEALGYHLYLLGGSTLSPRTSRDFQEQVCMDFVASPHPIRGPVGWFTVRDLAWEERLGMMGEFFDLPAHRWHAARLLTDRAAELEGEPLAAAIRQRLLDSGDPVVQEVFGERGARTPE